MDGDLVNGNNIQELMEEFQFDHTSGQWRLFIYSFKISLKAVLLHNGNNLPSITLVYAVRMTETFRFSCKTYAMKHKNICDDLKGTTMLIVLQGGYTKFCCFKCEWDSRARDCHYRIKINGHSVQKQQQITRMRHILL